MFVFTTQRGQPNVMTLLRKIFKFKELSELPISKRKSILEDI